MSRRALWVVRVCFCPVCRLQGAYVFRVFVCTWLQGSSADTSLSCWPLRRPPRTPNPHAIACQVLHSLAAHLLRKRHPTIAIEVAIYRIQNGKPARHKNPEKMGKKIEHGPKPEMAEKWPPEWKNGPQNGQNPILGPIFPFRWPLSTILGLGPFSIFFPIFSGFLCRAGFPILYMATSIDTVPFKSVCLSGKEKIHAQYDWTTGVLDNGNEWRKFRAVPRLYPLRSVVCTLFNKGGSRRVFRLPGAIGDHLHCTVEPSPGHIRCRKKHININKFAGLSGCQFFSGHSLWVTKST